jgi:hypothetical protein
MGRFVAGMHVSKRLNTVRRNLLDIIVRSYFRPPKFRSRTRFRMSEGHEHRRALDQPGAGRRQRIICRRTPAFPSHAKWSQASSSTGRAGGPHQ